MRGHAAFDGGQSVARMNEGLARGQAYTVRACARGHEVVEGARVAVVSSLLPKPSMLWRKDVAVPPARLPSRGMWYAKRFSAFGRHFR